MTRGGGELGKADMHLHTLYSDGTVSVGALLDHVEAETNLDVIAITDHERIDGALRAREMHAAGPYSFELVVGEEITTRRGHVLALFINSMCARTRGGAVAWADAAPHRRAEAPGDSDRRRLLLPPRCHTGGAAGGSARRAPATASGWPTGAV